jgi:two-component system nitrogen regulation response regulator GlnG
VIKQALLQATGPVLVPEFLPATFRPDDERPSGIPGLKEDAPDLIRFIQDRIKAGSTNLYVELQDVTDRLLFLQVLRSTDSNLSGAARILGISRTTLRNKLGGLGITIERSAALGQEEPEDGE